MALNYGTLEFKPEIEVKLNGMQVKMKDLLRKTYRDDIDFMESFKVIEVTKEYNGRPDLISQAVYHTDEYADILCKLNGISNPFELCEGNRVICPGEQLINKIADLDISQSNLEGLADDTSSLLKKYNNYKKEKNEKRSPNEATVFDHTYLEIPNTNLLIY